jgi:hypothetical protein
VAAEHGVDSADVPLPQPFDDDDAPTVTVIDNQIDFVFSGSGRIMPTRTRVGHESIVRGGGQIAGRTRVRDRRLVQRRARDEEVRRTESFERQFRRCPHRRPD